jgi:hypothetical protein
MIEAGSHSLHKEDRVSFRAGRLQMPSPMMAVWKAIKKEYRAKQFSRTMMVKERSCKNIKHVMC